MNRIGLKKVVFNSCFVFFFASAMIVMSSVKSHASDRMVEFAFGGTVSSVANLDTLPAGAEEWLAVQNGDDWSVTYQFKSWIPMTFVEQFGLDAYDGAVTSYKFKVERGGVEIASASLPAVQASWIFILDDGEVNPGEFVDRYSIQIRDAQYWDQGIWLTLQDNSASVFDSTALPLDGDINLEDYDSLAMQFGAGSFPTQPDDGGFQGIVTWHTSRATSPEPNGGCFIATAAYGSSMASHVKVLRDFRDQFLLKSSFGKAFVEFYYKYSPPIAHYISKNASLQVMVRLGLLPIVGISWITLKLGLFTTITLLFFCSIGLIRLISLLRRCNHVCN
jgi:hypothetical protein